MARQVLRDDQDLLARVACLYFIDGLTQEAVAREFLPARADVALVGIGTNDDSTTVWGGCFTTGEMDRLRRKRAVGDVLCRHFDRAGRATSSELCDRLIRLTVADLDRIGTVIALETPASSSRTRRSQTGGVQ